MTIMLFGLTQCLAMPAMVAGLVTQRAQFPNCGAAMLEGGKTLTGHRHSAEQGLGVLGPEALYA